MSCESQPPETPGGRQRHWVAARRHRLEGISNTEEEEPTLWNVLRKKRGQRERSSNLRSKSYQSQHRNRIQHPSFKTRVGESPRLPLPDLEPSPEGEETGAEKSRPQGKPGDPLLPPRLEPTRVRAEQEERKGKKPPYPNLLLTAGQTQQKKRGKGSGTQGTGRNCLPNVKDVARAGPDNIIYTTSKTLHENPRAR